MYIVPVVPFALYRQVGTIHTTLESDSGTDDRRLAEDLVEILATSVDADLHWQHKQTC